jgi:thiol-disulfide isomerase/thioredoxin
MAVTVGNLLKLGIRPDEYLKNTLESPRAADWRSVIESHLIDGKVVEGLSKIDRQFTLVCFSAYWCKDCLRYVPPLVESLHKAGNRNLRLTIIDYDENRNLAHRTGTKSIPQLIIFNDRANEVARIIEIPSPKYKSIEEELLAIIINKK